VHRSYDDLMAALPHIAAAPKDAGVLELVVRRPALGVRDVLVSAQLDTAEGVVGDTWNQRASKRTPDGAPHPDMQLNIISARVAATIADEVDHRALAGDQLHVDLDLSVDNLPAGTQLRIGNAVIEVTDQPHTGCAKFAERFGRDAQRWVMSTEGKQHRLRGINARVVVPGTVTTGDTITVVRSEQPFVPAVFAEPAQG
jgi:MOSC domain-containing protein YiiM